MQTACFRLNALLAALAVLGLAFAPHAGAAAWNETVLHSFQGPPSDGLFPQSALVFDPAGNLYGTTIEGGSGNGQDCIGLSSGCGVLFKLAPDGTESVLYAWCKGGPTECDDGAVPVGDMVLDKRGNIYGVTAYGGLSCSGCGVGTLFKVAPDGTETVLHAFDCEALPCSDGSAPEAGLIRAGKTLYGTTQEGGTNNGGTLFSMSLKGKEKVLHAFCLDQDPQNFICLDGEYPEGTLTMDAAGNLYGTAAAGGSVPCNYGEGFGCGIVFRLAPDGTFSILHEFSAGNDGATPLGNVVFDRNGNLYGTTFFAGGTCSANASGCGAIFKIAPDGTESIVHAFNDAPDGRQPFGDLTISPAGDIYGTTEHGGVSEDGVVFKLSPRGRFTVLHSFCADVSCPDGTEPMGGVTWHKGALYGTASGGGASNGGLVFNLAK